ncbi:13511_t:CDS:2 [Funneliformis geosporum]|nr:13511_t:CDS:2 [Funneliformis geosporum]
MVKQMLSVKIDAGVFQQLKSEISKGNISGFVERAVAKELGKHDDKLEREQKEFQKKLIADYKRASSSKNLQKEENFDKEELKKSIASFEVLIEPNEKNGLDETSKILLNRLQIVDKDFRLIRKVGQVDSKIWKQVWKAL